MTSMQIIHAIVTKTPLPLLHATPAWPLAALLHSTEATATLPASRACPAQPCHPPLHLPGPRPERTSGHGGALVQQVEQLRAAQAVRARVGRHARRQAQRRHGQLQVEPERLQRPGRRLVKVCHVVSTPAAWSSDILGSCRAEARSALPVIPVTVPSHVTSRQAEHRQSDWVSRRLAQPCKLRACWHCLRAAASCLRRLERRNDPARAPAA